MSVGVVLVQILFIHCLKSVLAFNVDTDSSLVFKGPTDSYFGYSVAILENSQGTWLLAGAPRANDSSLPDVHEPGAVFQCNWQYRSSCQPVFIDDFGNEKQTFYKWKNVTVHHKKSNQWLGASIDVNAHSDLQVMICAPRWIDHKFYVQGLEFMNGLCYESKSDLRFHESSAWPALEYLRKQVHRSGFFAYGMGSMGTSAAYSQDGKFVILGAPGLNDWSGGFAFVEAGSNSRPRILELPMEDHSNSYFGMAVTTARLSAEDVFTVIGGPRAGGVGKVFGYNKKFQLVLVKDGEQLGSSFGASVCAADLNGDGLDDLIVGAPMYSDQLDEGRVYVYINREFFSLELLQPSLSGRNVPNARFGTALANTGDLNHDNFEDIAVGAPYEEGSGVVYIYNGAKNGLYSEPSQRIVGRDIHSSLKTFGWSFSRPWDVDNNHYKDFAVGAFESNMVVLLRTRSVLDLFASLQVSPSVIDIKKRPACSHQGHSWHCFTAHLCLKYSGKNLPPSSEVNMTMTLDTLEKHRGERSRLFVLSRDDMEKETVNELVTLRLERNSCWKKYVYIRPNSRDIITPLQLQVDFEIASNSIGIASMCTICPIRNKYIPNTVTTTTRFALECGDDHECHPDLSLKARPLFKDDGKFFLIDTSPWFDVELTVGNTGEISYLTVLTVEHPPSVVYSSLHVVGGGSFPMCAPGLANTNSTYSYLLCDLSEPVRTGQKTVLRMRFYAQGVPYDVFELNMNFNVSSTSEEGAHIMLDNSVQVKVPLQMRTQLKLAGVSLPSQVSLPHANRRSEDMTEFVSLTHLYILHNLGPSPMPHGQLTLKFPELDWFLVENIYVERKSVTDAFSKVPVECNQSPNRSHPDAAHSGDGDVEGGALSDGFKYLTCENTVCLTITCYVGLMHVSETVYVNMSLSMRTRVLDELKGPQQVGVTSVAFMEEPAYTVYHSLASSHNASTTSYIVYESLPLKAVTWWVLVISISSGLLLLYIIGIILWKCGFFRRKKKEELQRLIRSTEAEREMLHSDSLSAGSSEVMMPPPAHGGANGIDHLRHGLELDQRLFYPHMSLDDDGPLDRSPHQGDFFHNQSLNRRDIRQGNHNPSYLHSFHTLQGGGGGRSRNPGHGTGVRSNGHHNLRHNLWVAPPPAPAPPPSFNNEMYLEPLETRA
ncbi:integrin alpha-9 [Aplysia californica]|uniref:Integrin alpha-9 n=1 Tax=Aplysia californica TaxID=6500 RepID=A0ABM0ZYE1_APLCA|nr:integrin alpha-9 [Aplysia californica]